MAGRTIATLSLIILAVGLTGCHFFTFLAVMAGPPRVQKAEFHFGQGKVAIFIESAAADGNVPIFERELALRLSEMFRSEKISSNVVPLDRSMSLPLRHPDFRTWSLQKIGRTLGADQLLYVRIMELRVRETADHPLVSPMAQIELKVIDVNAPPSRARIWPENGARELPLITRQPQEAASREKTDSAIIKLARDCAYRIAEPFYDVDLESPKLREP